MKLSLAILWAILGFSQAFVVAPSRSAASKQRTQLKMDRREIMTKTAGLVAAGVVLGPNAAFAADYVPRYEDMKQIYFLGASLDKLIAKLSNPDTVEAGLDGIRQCKSQGQRYLHKSKSRFF
jgi:hypothetical protein